MQRFDLDERGRLANESDEESPATVIWAKSLCEKRFSNHILSFERHFFISS